jgi:hypothetical protein
MAETPVVNGEIFRPGAVAHPGFTARPSSGRAPAGEARVRIVVRKNEK